MIKKINIIKYRDFKKEQVLDTVAVEVDIILYVNSSKFFVVTASPDMHKELAVGILFNESVITSYTDILNIDYDASKSKIYIQIKDSLKKSSKLKNKPIKNYKFNINDCYLCMSKILRSSKIFEKTGGVHTAGLAVDGKLIKVCEDISRHNVLSKLIGYALVNDISLAKSFIVSTGRISSKIVLTAAKASIPLFVSHSAPTDKAIEVADLSGITVVGFLRGHNCNVYTHGDFICS